MRRFQLLVAICLVIFAANEVFAFGLGFSGRASTLGFGPEAIVGLSSKMHLRVGMNNYTINNIYGSNVESQYEYLANVQLKSMVALLDWYPFAGKFHLTTGLVMNENFGEVTVSPIGTYEIGNKQYAPEDIGSLYGSITFKKHVPYFGIGIGNPLDKNYRIGFMFDIGMVYQNSPQVDFTADGMIAPTAEQDEDVQAKLAGWKAYGVISLGFSVRMF